MYLDTKTNMLEIIEEGLQLKLEINTIKEQFYDLLQNFDKYDSSSATNVQTLQNKMPLLGLSSPSCAPASPSKGISAARARVKAMYDARKARLLAGRSLTSSAAQGSAPKPPKRRKDNV